MREAASRGFWVASRVPYGYRKLMVQDGAKKRPSLEPDAATSAVVERIFGMAEAGRGILAITRTLNDEGIANPTGRLWSKNGVHIILRNEVYTGSLVWGTDAKDKAEPVRVEKAFPAIISKAQFRRVNRKLLPPHVIMRRRSDVPEEERVRISSELRRVQTDLAFHSAWLMTESRHVHRSFDELLEQVRHVAGMAMHEAWLQPAAEDDSNMNMPKLDMSSLASYESAYLAEVVDHLSIWPRSLRRLFRRKPKG